MATFTVLLITLLAIAVIVYHFWSQCGRKLPPGVRRLPGPKGLLFIGRVHDVPSKATWLKFWEWSQEYGPIYQMEIFGSIHVWISSDRISNDLLAKRGSIYSDRPVIPNLPDNRTSGDYLPLLGHNETWKRQRRFAHHIMSRSAQMCQHSYPTSECKRLLYNLSKDPTNYVFLLEEFTGRSISLLAWGSADHAPELKVDTFGLLVAISPSGAVPNVVSWLAGLPAWISPWKRTEINRHDNEREFFYKAFNGVKDSYAKGEAKPSYVKMFLEIGEKMGLSDEEGAYCSGMMAIAGALTLASPMMSFILAMVHFPEWQNKLLHEIEQVCGGKCPEWTDKENLPLLRAVVKEILRWRPPVPTGIPHRLETDDIYDGYFIPAGATIHALEWGITRDPNMYPDPEAFRPDRWLSSAYPTYREPLTEHPNLKGYHQFGYGRRVCQGVDIVEQELFLVMGGIAWAFEISKKKDEFGIEIEVPADSYTSLLIAKPEKFEFELKPRSDEKKAMVEEAWKDLK